MVEKSKSATMAASLTAGGGGKLDGIPAGGDQPGGPIMALADPLETLVAGVGLMEGQRMDNWEVSYLFSLTGFPLWFIIVPRAMICFYSKLSPWMLVVNRSISCTQVTHILLPSFHLIYEHCMSSISFGSLGHASNLRPVALFAPRCPTHHFRWKKMVQEGS